jgi:hypothetical protein
MNINSQNVRYSDGSHHMLIFSTSYTELPTVNKHGQVVDTADGNVFACPEGPAPDWNLTGVIGGSQNPEWDPKPLPEGVAVVVPPNSWIIINMHMLNSTPESVSACVKNNFGTIPTDEVEHEAGFLFWYNPFITVPAQGTSRATLRCPIIEDITVLNGQSHMHSRGSGYVAKLFDGEGNYVEDIYHSNDWETPVPIDYEPALQIPAGHSIEYTCEYTNAEERTVNQGLKTTDEMCMFIGMYYPRSAYQDDCGPATGLVALGTPSYDGDKTGTETLECWFGAESVNGNFTTAQQDCITDSCAAPQMWGYLLCALENSESCAESCQVRSNIDLYTNSCMAQCQPEMAQAQTDCQVEELMLNNQARCTTETPMAIYTAVCTAQADSFDAACASEECADSCTDPEAEGCTTCKSGCVTERDRTCVQDLVTTCVTEMVTACVTESATACIQPCVVETVTKCATECLNTVVCADAYDSVMDATCEE